MDYKKMFTLSKTENGVVIKKYKATDAVVEIPETIDDNKVVAIAEIAFKGKDIEELVLPKSIVSIGERAFFECKKLKKVTLENGITMDKFAFYGCESLADESGFVIVGDILFDYYGKASSIVIPDGVKIVDDSVFDRVKRGLESVVIPERVEVVRPMAFYGCKKLKSVSINPKKTRMFASSFDDCTSLVDEDGFIIFDGYLCAYRVAHSEKIEIPSNIREIGIEAIQYQDKVQSIVIPDGVEKIDTYAFFCCAGILEAIHIPDSVVNIDKNAFVGCNVTIVAPAGSYAIEYAKENNIPFKEE